MHHVQSCFTVSALTHSVIKGKIKSGQQKRKSKHLLIVALRVACFIRKLKQATDKQMCLCSRASNLVSWYE